MKKNYKNVVAGIMLLAGAYFVYRYFKSAPKKVRTPDILDMGPQVPVTASTFPLKKGSKGAKVLELQNAIMSINPNLLPRYGADGDFGSETELAVSRMLGKKTVDSQADIETIKKGKNTKARG